MTVQKFFYRIWVVLLLVGFIAPQPVSGLLHSDNTITRTGVPTQHATLPSAVTAAHTSVSDVVISQVYGGGGGSGYYRYDYVELFNAGADTISLDGWSLQYGSATGGFAAFSNNLYAFPLNTTIAPGHYLLIQLGPVGTGGGDFPVTPDLTTGNLNMSLSSGKVALVNVVTALGCGETANLCALPDPRIVDLVAYGESNNAEGGISVNHGAALTNQQGAVRKLQGCQDTDVNGNDFDVLSGAALQPRNNDSPSYTCPVVTISKTVTPTANVAYQSTVTYTVSLENGMPVGDTVLFTDTLPAEIAFGRWVENPGATFDDDTITWTGVLTANTTLTFTFEVTYVADYSGVVTNVAHFRGMLQQGSASAIFTGPMQADFTASPTSGRAPLTVVFTDTSTGPVDRRLWDFGDGADDTRLNPAHSYATPGIYTVSLTLYDIHTYSATLTRPDFITVLENHPPTAHPVILTPTTACAKDNLVMTYHYYDPNDDPEGDTVIAWTRNDAPEPDFDGVTVVPYHRLERGDVWCVTVIPHDGYIFGEAVSACVTALPANRPPTIAAVTVAPDAPTATDVLTMTYSGYSDLDCDPENTSILTGTLIHWSQNGWLQPGLTNQSTVPASITQQGDVWCAAVMPHDGFVYGSPLETCVIIGGVSQNRPPTVMTVTVTPASPTVQQALYVAYKGYFDPDGDPENTAATQIRWLRNSLMQPAFMNANTVPAYATYIGEVWCATVRPHDGIVYGPMTTSNCVVIRSDHNHPPSALDVMLTPPLVFSGDPITVTYTFSDVETLVHEGETQIRWYRNYALQSAYNDQRTVPPGVTLAGETWYATVRPHDGEDYGALVSTPPVVIAEITGNLPPEVRNVKIHPALPGTQDLLRLTYAYVDPEDDPPGSLFRIRWFRNLEHIAEYDGLTVVPDAATEINDVWFAMVTPHDGHNYGSTVYAPAVTIQAESGNTPPVARNVYLSPRVPGVDDRLRLHYTFYDVDGDPDHSQIHWSADGQAQPAFEDYSVIPATATTIGQVWCAIVTPHDGREAGRAVTSCVTIQEEGANTPPEAQDVYISPHRPATGDHLVLHYRCVDEDGDTESATRLWWYKDGILQVAYEGQTVAPASATQAGERWYATVQCFDGLDYGDVVTAPTLIVNHLPVASAVRIVPTEPESGQSLAARYDFSDADNDPPEPPHIRWYRNATLQAMHNDREYIPAGHTHAGETWFVVITPYDGLDYGTPTTSTVTTIHAASPKPPVYIYQPLILNNYSTYPYEPNNTWYEAYPIQPGQSYEAYPNDLRDYYALQIDRQSMLRVEVHNYRVDGQLQIRYEPTRCDMPNRAQAPQRIAGYFPVVGVRPETMIVPTAADPHALHNLSPGCYYVYIYTADGFTTAHKYRLTTYVMPVGE